MPKKESSLRKFIDIQEKKMKISLQTLIRSFSMVIEKWQLRFVEHLVLFHLEALVKNQNPCNCFGHLFVSLNHKNIFTRTSSLERMKKK